jgi:hypothetical protein
LQQKGGPKRAALFFALESCVPASMFPEYPVLTLVYRKQMQLGVPDRSKEAAAEYTAVPSCMQVVCFPARGCS